jgi:membrane protein DedA with SNARE-associated domain
LGTFAWASAFTLVGYAFHESFESATHLLTHILFGGAVVAALVLAFRQHRLQRSMA